jgi:hypothetical protein
MERLLVAFVENPTLLLSTLLALIYVFNKLSKCIDEVKWGDVHIKFKEGEIEKRLDEPLQTRGKKPKLALRPRGTGRVEASVAEMKVRKKAVGS